MNANTCFRSLVIHRHPGSFPEGDGEGEKRRWLLSPPCTIPGTSTERAPDLVIMAYQPSRVDHREFFQWRPILEIAVTTVAETLSLVRPLIGEVRRQFAHV